MRINDRKKYRISGHESFSCRYAWLPKIVRLVQKNKAIFSDDEKVMVELGIGKNMVRSARFWAQAGGIIHSSKEEISLTPFAEAVLGKKELDPYIEDICTLWLLHWNFATDIEVPLLAWDFLLNRWHEPEIVPSMVVKQLLKEVSRSDSVLSTVTIEQHFQVFLHTYLPSRAKEKFQEDNLDCPLVELELLRKIGDREPSANKSERETIYAFAYGDKPDITAELFVYCIADFWKRRFPQEQTLTFRDIAHGEGSPGQVFKLPEDAIRTRLENLNGVSMGYFHYVESAHLPQLHKNEKTSIDFNLLLDQIYKRNKDDR